MRYIIDTHDTLTDISKILMSVDNSKLNLEYCLERIRLSLNGYIEYDGIMRMLSDLCLSVSQDQMLTNRLLGLWTPIVLKIYYYIIQEDIELPITGLDLVGLDLVITTGG